MRITIDEKIVESSGLSMPELFVIFLVKLSDNIPKLFQEAEQKQIITKSIFGGYLVTQKYNDLADSIVLDSETRKEKKPEDKLTTLAVELMKIFDKGRKKNKDGTLSPYYFKCNKREVTLKLKKFFKLYGDNYTDEQILNAARRYVDSFNGNYTYMRLLKYFIHKNDPKIDAEGNRYSEEVSELATLIDNEDSGQTVIDWTTELK